MSDLDLFADLVTRKLVSRDGGAVTLPSLVLGDVLRCSLRTMERNEAGDLRERDLRVRTLRASVGKVLEPPVSGWFKLWIGDHDTPQINFDSDAETFKTAAQGSGIIDTVETTLEAQNASLDKQIADIDRRLVAERTRLEGGFIRMEQAQSLINSQLAALQRTLNLPTSQ